MAQMTRGQIDAFLRETRIAKLVTLYPSGAPTVAAIWYEWNGAGAHMFTHRDSEKVRRIRSDARVCLFVETGVGEPEAWVAVEGAAEVREQGGMDLARRLARRYYPPDRAEGAIQRWEAMADAWVVLTVTPRRIRSLAPG